MAILLPHDREVSRPAAIPTRRGRCAGPASPSPRGFRELGLEAVVVDQRHRRDGSASFCGYGISSFQALFLNRTSGLLGGRGRGCWINVPACARRFAGAALATGWAGRSAWPAATPAPSPGSPGFGMIVCVAPFYLLAFSTHQLLGLRRGALRGRLLPEYGYLAAQYTIGQGVG